MNVNFNILISLFIISLFLSCSTAPEFERDNENDFGSEQFLPDPPSDTNYSITNENYIHLNWADNSTFETSYRIYKALGDTSSYNLLAELPVNTVSFIDSSGNFAFPTIYKIVSVVEETESNAQKIEIYFGEISGLFASKTGNEIELKWTDNVSLHDGYIITRSPDESDELIFLKVVSKVTKSIRFDIPQDGFVQNFYLRPFKIFNSDSTTLNSTSALINSAGPSNIQLSLISNDSLKINWSDNSFFEDSFEINILNNDKSIFFTSSKDITTSYFSNDFRLSELYTVRVRGVSGQSKSPFVSTNLSVNIPPPSVEVISVSNDQLYLKIEEQASISRELDIYRSEDEGADLHIGSIPKGDSIFIDNSVTVFNKYSYFVSSPISLNSERLDVQFQKGLKLLKRLTDTEGLTNLSSFYNDIGLNKNSDKLVYRSSWNPITATIMDPLEENKILEFEIPFNPNTIKFDNDETRIFISNLESPIIYIFDFNSGHLIDSLVTEYSGIMDFKLLNTNIVVATVHNNNENFYVLEIDLSDKSNEIILSPEKYLMPELFLSSDKEKLIVLYEKGSFHSYLFYTIDDQLVFNKEVEYPFYSSNFSSDLDTAVVMKSDEITLIDINTGIGIWSFEHYSISNYCCSNIQILPESFIALQSKYCTYLIDTKLSINQITDIHCDDSRANQQGRLSAKRILYMNKHNLLMDFRRSHSNGYNDFIDLLIPEYEWKEVYEE